MKKLSSTYTLTQVTVGEFAFWNNPADPMGGRPWKEGGGPLSKLLSSGDTSTNRIRPVESKSLNDGKSLKIGKNWIKSEKSEFIFY